MSCIICEAPTTARFMCIACARSYDRQTHVSGDIFVLIKWAAKRARACARKSKLLTVKQAMALCAKLVVPTYDAGMGYKAVSDGAEEMAEKLSRKHPPHRFRVITCHERETTYPAFTVKNPDPREYNEMAKRGVWTDGGYQRFKKKGARA